MLAISFPFHMAVEITSCGDFVIYWKIIVEQAATLCFPAHICSFYSVWRTLLYETRNQCSGYVTWNLQMVHLAVFCTFHYVWKWKNASENVLQWAEANAREFGVGNFSAELNYKMCCITTDRRLNVDCWLAWSRSLFDNFWPVLWFEVVKVSLYAWMNERSVLV